MFSVSEMEKRGNNFCEIEHYILFLGKKRTKIIREKLGIDTINQLENACKENRISKLRGFGKKSEKRILEDIEFYRKNPSYFDQKASSNHPSFAGIVIAGIFSVMGYVVCMNQKDLVDGSHGGIGTIDAMIGFLAAGGFWLGCGALAWHWSFMLLKKLFKK